MSPTVETLGRLLDLLGEELVLDAQPVDSGVDRSLYEITFGLSPTERVRAASQAARSMIVISGRER